MKALITGGAGFIGSHLSDRLVAAGHRVTAVDDLSTGRLENVAHLEGAPGFQFVHESIMHEAVMDRLVSECDVVYHLASAVGVELIVSRPVEVIERCILGTEIVLKTAHRYKKKVLLTSTSEVYGKNQRVPFAEDDDRVLGPTTKSRWSYSCAKAIDEFLALAYLKEKKLPIVIVRLFNTVGPRQTGQYGMVVPRFVQQALAGKPLTVYGDGSQQRCFGYVGDVVGALVGLILLEPDLGTRVPHAHDQCRARLQRGRVRVTVGVDLTHLGRQGGGEIGHLGLLIVGHGHDHVVGEEHLTIALDLERVPVI